MHVMKRFFQHLSSFYFSHVDKNAALKEIKKLNLNKAVQDSDSPVKILKENVDFFADYIYLQFNEAVDSSKFADFFKSADISAASKQGLQKGELQANQNSASHFKKFWKDYLQATLKSL